jgi:hypothetical protein
MATSLLSIPGRLLCVAGLLLAIDPLGVLEPWAPAPVGPLRELFFDDSDTVHNVYLPAAPSGDYDPFYWQPYLNPPNDHVGNSLRVCGPVRYGSPPNVVRATFVTTGTIEEGPVFHLANEVNGPLEVWINGQYYTTLNVVSLFDKLRVNVYDMRRYGVDTGGGLENGNGGRPFLATTLFPAGTHTVELHKIPNESGNNNSYGDRVTYYDGWTLFTRHSTYA